MIQSLVIIMRTLIALIVALGLSPGAGRAQDSREERAELAASIVAQLWPQVVASIDETAKAISSTAPAEHRDALSGAFGALANDARYRDIVIDVWSRNFTAPELRQIRGFYDTPAGRSLLAKTPQIARETNAAVQRLLVEAIARTTSTEGAASTGRPPAPQFGLPPSRGVLGR
ncbi:MAG TPA: DUF2059 domain-containing protein [Alphaproteobacteria bacterium]|nr:DUF2059 domain-containing protein [Alphaproteobacteria bacterium]